MWHRGTVHARQPTRNRHASGGSSRTISILVAKRWPLPSLPRRVPPLSPPPGIQRFRQRPDGLPGTWCQPAARRPVRRRLSA